MKLRGTNKSINQKKVNGTDYMLKLHYEEVTSTQDIGKDLIKQGDLDFMITSDTQSKGRGKLHSKWYSDKGKNMLLSFSLPCPDMEKLYIYAIISCVGVRRILNKYGIEGDIKAPNDVYVKGKKICGILCEAEYYEKIPYIIVGIGINVYSTEFPAGLNATSMINEIPNLKVNIRDLAEEVTCEVRKVYNEDFETVQKEYNMFLKEIG